MPLQHVSKYQWGKPWWQHPEAGYTSEEITLIHKLIELELPVDEIARRDGVSKRTILRKLKAIYDKTGVENYEQGVVVFTQVSAPKS